MKELAVPFDTIAEWILRWEAFENDYPEVVEQLLCQGRPWGYAPFCTQSQRLLTDYLAPGQATPPERKESYRWFLAEGQGSRYYDQVKEALAALT